MEPIGVVGTGQLGACFVDRLLGGGHEVVAFDIDEDALSKSSAAGAVVASSPAEVANQCRVVIICVTGPSEVTGCVFGEGGIIETVHSGSVIVDTTTSLPDTTRAVEVRLRELGAYMIDAPVSRGIPAARQGTLSMMVGGSQSDIARVTDLLALLATDIVRVGSVGSGHAVKLVNMMLMGAHLIAVSEALGIAATMGFSAGETAAALNLETTASYMTANHLPSYVIKGTYQSGFTLGLMAKDIRLANQMSTQLGLILPVFHRVGNVYDLAEKCLGPNSDNMLIVPFLAALASGLSVTESTEAAFRLILPDSRSSALGRSDPKSLMQKVTDSNRRACLESLQALMAFGTDIEQALSVIDVSSGASFFTHMLLGEKVESDSSLLCDNDEEKPWSILDEARRQRRAGHTTN